MAFDSRAVSKCAETLSLTSQADKVGLPMCRVSEGVLSTHGQDGAIVLDIRQGQMFNLNFVGSRILELLETGEPEPAIVKRISQEFKVDHGTAERDLREFLETLRQHSLLEEHGSNGQH